MTTTERATPTTGRLPSYRPPKGQRSREVLRGVASVLAVLAIVVGVPLGLLLGVGSPLPSSLPSRDVLTSPLDAGQLLRIVSVVVWLAWAHFMGCLLVEWRSERRGVGLPSHVPLGGGSQAVARRLVAAILLLAGTTVVAAPLLPADVPAARPATSASAPVHAAAGAEGRAAASAQRAAAQEQAAATRTAADSGVKVFYDVAPPAGRHHDSLWDIAERYLGDGRRYHEIFALNQGSDQPDGRRLEHARLIRPGWVLQLPADARGPGLRVVTPPAVQSSGSTSGGSTATDSTAASTSEQAAAHDAATTPAEHGSLPWRGGIGASLIAAGLLASLRRSRGNAPVEPDATGVEQALRLAADETGAAFLDQSLRGLVGLVAAADRPMPEVYAACLGPEQLILSVSPPRDDAPAPWTSSADGRSWTITRSAAAAVDVADDVLAPYPGLACFGEQDSWRMLLDLESAPGVISIGGDAVTARALAASVAVELATNAWSDTVRVTLVGFGDELDGLAPGRLQHADRLDDVLVEIEARAARQAGARATDSVLRGRGRRPDRAAWAPDFLVLSGAPDAAQLDALNRLTGDARNACGVLTVGDVTGARWRFVIGTDGRLNTGPLGLMLDAALLPVQDYRSLAPLFDAADQARRATSGDVASGLEQAGDAASAAVGRPPLSVAPARPVPQRHLEMAARLPIEVSVLGPLQVDAPGDIDADRRELAAELVVLLALHPDGVHPNVIAASLWPRGVTDPVRDSTLTHVQGWLGRDSAGRPRLRQDAEGRWVLDQDVRCDWWVFRALSTRADESPDAVAAADLREQALGLVTGPAFENLPSGRYSWLAHSSTERDVRRGVVGTAHALAAHALQTGDPQRAEAAARAGLRLLPEAEALWRDLLVAVAASGDRDRLVSCAQELYDALALRRVARPESPTEALVDELLPGFRRRVA